MRRKLTILLGALLVTGAVNAYAAAPSSAAQLLWHCGPSIGEKTGYKDSRCREGGPPFNYKWFRYNENAGSVIVSAGATFALKLTVGIIPVTVTCTSQSAKGTMENPTGGGSAILNAGASMTLSGCTTNQKECVVKNVGGTAGTIKTASLKGLAGESGSPAVVGLRFEPSTGEVFVEIELSACSTTGLNGKYQITGSAFGVANNTSSSLEFTATSSSLKLGGGGVTLVGTTVEESEAGEALKIE